MEKALADAIILSDNPGGLGAVRSLARRGVSVTAVAFEKKDIVLYSRWASKVLKVNGRDNNEKESNLLKILLSLLGEGHALLATSDRLVAFMSRYELELLKKFRFRLPPSDMIEALNDKSQETKLVQTLGFAIPPTVQKLPATPDLLEKQIQLPIIFKPYGYFNKQLFPKKNEVVRSRAELHKFYEEWRKALPVLLAQEVIPGPDSESWICSCTFDEDHQLLDCAVKQKLRAYPAHFGGSTFAISRNNPEIIKLAADLGQRLGYVGHAGIEFRRDPRDNIYKYIELNPRMPANVGFDEASGLPTVWNSYLVALYGKIDYQKRHQREGMIYLDLWYDLGSQLADRRSLLKIIIGYAKIVLKPRNGPYFAWDDPVPGLVAAWQFVVTAIRLVFRRVFVPRVSKKAKHDNF
jgi:predicted ATP-grasp superfamily ATP-dependent carboligase